MLFAPKGQFRLSYEALYVTVTYIRQLTHAHYESSSSVNNISSSNKSL
jgi:hypothetical protein